MIVSEGARSAIGMRVGEGIRVIPVKYEDANVPELLRTQNYVVCTNHAPQVFEMQFSRLIDALNNLETNPFR